MRRFRLARRAEEDITEIFAFGYGLFGEAQADAYADGMFHVFALLADNPRMGRPAKTIAPGVRRHEYRSHVILYEEAPDGVMILAVVHGRSVAGLSF
ncbi:type II toxin-antitoxin system RelE/ParE family toxin [Jiella endophytica]|uniref:Toxin n=1 Tax=Jiella endophytica TaxID=2558362 RepID=A0A4Y8R9X3_9HYPH|nr:type II toxin-antitoxin system RelE/ParE family toxin [Jiella endophytica]TFF18407.1 type II toxin-antitoxin system RelE/ParE family toxin [Jiella endophytica]